MNGSKNEGAKSGIPTKYKSPLDAWKNKQDKQNKQRLEPKEQADDNPKYGEYNSYADWYWAKLKKWGYPGHQRRPGDVVDGTCPYHGRVKKVLNGALFSVCTVCYPEDTE